MQVARLPMLALLVEPAVVVVVEEEEPIMAGLPAIKAMARVLQAIIEL